MTIRAALLVLLGSSAFCADIYRWDTGEVMRGTEGIDAGPGVQLAGRTTQGPDRQLEYLDLEFADLTGVNLSGADFYLANLTNAGLRGADLTGATLRSSILADADFSGANLTNATLIGGDFRNADFTEANVAMAFCLAPTLSGFTKEPLYSTASYKAKDLSGIALWGAATYFFIIDGSDLTGWNFSGQDLTGADPLRTTPRLHLSISLAATSLTQR